MTKPHLIRNVLVLWPEFQPVGQLVTLVKDPLNLPMVGAQVSIEAFILMLVLVVFAAQYQRNTKER